MARADSPVAVNELVRRTVRNPLHPRQHQGVTDEEAEEILGPAIMAIVAAIPTPAITPEQVDLLVCLLTGSDLENNWT